MSKKERLSEFNRSNILTAAKTLFHEKGITQTTMDDISKEADCSKSTLYVYFKSKDEIYNYIVLEQFESLKSAIGEAIHNAQGFPDGYFAVCNTMAEFYTAHPLYLEGIFSEIKMPDDKSETVLLKIYEVGEELNAIIENYMKVWTEKKYICLDIPLLQAAFVLWAGITGVIVTAHKKEIYINKAMGITKEDFMQAGFDLLLKSIKKGKLTP